MQQDGYRPMFGDARIGYALFGMLFGFCFPVIATLFDAWVQGVGYSWDALTQVQRSQPLHWIIDSAPLFLGLFAYMAGLKQHEVIQINAGLENEVRQRTAQLSVQNEELRLTHAELESSLERISQSINYAQRIQDAIISDLHQLKEDFPNSSVLFRPRDVVSGDFPWYLKHEGQYYFAAVDCTGHGVPGAFMSLIGYFMLNRIVKDQGITDTGDILCNLHLAVVNVLNQHSDSRVHDGMDLALCRVDPEKMEVQSSGACNPVYHVHKGELTVYNGDIWSIGGTDYKKRCPYTSKTFGYAKGDVLTMFSDGVTDQFDAKGERKFGYSPIRKLVVDEGSGPVPGWNGLLDSKMNAWMGDYRQMDDMLLMAVQL